MINLILAILKKYRVLVVYCVIGCTGATLDFLVYAGLTSFVGLHYQFANFIGVTFGIVNNFIWNYYFNFKVRNHFFLRLASFYGVGMVGCTLSAGCLWLFVEKFALNTLIAKLGTIFFVTIVQFCLNKFITFKRRNSYE